MIIFSDDCVVRECFVHGTCVLLEKKMSDTKGVEVDD